MTDPVPRVEAGAPEAIGDVEVHTFPGSDLRGLGSPPRPVLLAPPGAQISPAGLRQAAETLARAPRCAALIELERAPDSPSLLLDLATTPERLGAVLIRPEFCAGLRERLPEGPLVRASLALRLAVGAEVRAFPGPVVLHRDPEDPPDPEALGRFYASAIRGFAAEDLYPPLRPQPATLDLVSALGDWTARMLRRNAYPEAFALGEYATAIAEGRNTGRSPRVGRPEPAVSRGPEPMITLILPTRDRPDLLVRALESIEEQTYPDLEVIVVVDGGDDPGPLLDGFSERIGGGGRLTRVRHDRRRGAGAARNTGLRLARGRYVGFLDDDDRILPHHCEALLGELLRGTRAVHGDVRLVSELRTRPALPPVTLTTSLPYQSALDWSFFALDNQLPIHSVLLERQLLVSVGGFDEHLTVLEDWDLWLRVFATTPPRHVPRVVAEVRTRNDGSRITQKHRREWIDALALVYGRTLSLERANPGLRDQRLHYIIAQCRDRKFPFPGGATTWLRGEPGLLPIDPGEWQAQLDGEAQA